MPTEKLPDSIPASSKIYDLTLLEIGTDLYIVNGVSVNSKTADINSYIGKDVYKVYSSGTTVSENIQEFIKNDGIPSVGENAEAIGVITSSPSELGSTLSPTIPTTTTSPGELDSTIQPILPNSGAIASSSLNPNIVESSSKNKKPHIKEENDDDAFESAIGTQYTNKNKNEHIKEQLLLGGDINYTYKLGSYPKNVSFSKKNPHKKTNKKTLRKLQRIINNAQ